MPYDPAPPGGGSPLRRAIERRTAVWIVWLARLPRWVPAVIVAAVFLTGLAVPGVAGAVALALVALLLGLLVYLAWPLLAPSARWLRLAILVVVILYAVARAAGYGHRS